ncbi:uncharacterized protein LOC128995605 [Macrosteles quadrilineatus]|uniref:uncharacterized protein LOC128995605 n=1 Tax=Macrosteles quadrilineatus TaxID=74068 RepID=UPI0023E0ADFA|nr:uncharacterized protein LOC128995605 [Macrosteles quadrilineatus]
MSTLKYATVLLFFIISIEDVQVTKTFKKTFPVLFFKTTKSVTEKSGKQLFPLLQPQQGTVNCETECSEDDWGFLDILDIFSDDGDDKCTVDCKFTYSGGTTSTVKEQDNDGKKIEEAIKKLKEELKIEQEKNKREEEKKKLEEENTIIKAKIEKLVERIKVLEQKPTPGTPVTAVTPVVTPP